MDSPPMIRFRGMYFPPVWSRERPRRIHLYQVIPAKRLKHILMNVGEKLGEGEIERALEEAELDPTGTVKYEDLIKKVMAKKD